MRTAPACSTLQVLCWRIHRFIVYLQRSNNANAGSRLDDIPETIMRRGELALDQQNITNPKHYNEYFESDANVSMPTVTVLLPRM